MKKRLVDGWAAASYLNFKRWVRLIEFNIKRSLTKNRSSQINLEEIRCFYINLKSRPDRRDVFERNIQRFSFFKVERVEAVKFAPGFIGCTLSHILALSKARFSGATCILICEDDVDFLIEPREMHLYIERFMKSKADVLCLGNNVNVSCTFDDLFYRALNTQTASAYIVKSTFLEVLISQFMKAFELSVCGVAEKDSAVDQYWKFLQTKYVFIIPKLRVAVQRSSYSDIRNGLVNYET